MRRAKDISKRAFLVLSIILIVVGLCLILYFHDIPTSRFIETITTGILALGFGFLPLGIQKAFFEENTQLFNDIKKVVSDSTDDIRKIIDIGIQRVFPNRKDGLEEFLNSHFQPDEKRCSPDEKHLAIVGSSLMGLIGQTTSDGHLIKQNKPQKDFCDNLKKALNSGWTVRIIMTHPAFADLRSLAEVRCPGEIKEEVVANLRYLFENFIENIKERNMEILLYQGSPTMFIIATPDAMLINPYLHSSTAMGNVCIEIHPASSAGGVSLYHTIHHSHFEQIWDHACTTPVRSKEDMEYILETQDSKANLLKFLDDEGYLDWNIQERKNIPSAKNLP